MNETSALYYKALTIVHQGCASLVGGLHGRARPRGGFSHSFTFSLYILYWRSCTFSHDGDASTRRHTHDHTRVSRVSQGELFERVCTGNK